MSDIIGKIETVTCVPCEGTGHFPRFNGEMFECNHCDGVGKVTVISKTCETCDGDGYLYTVYGRKTSYCLVCRSSGITWGKYKAEDAEGKDGQ